MNEPAHDVGGGRLVATVTDPDGNVPELSAADGHAVGQPDRQEPGRHPGRSAGAGPHPRHVDDRGPRRVLEIDALPQERGDRFVARTGFDPRALAAG